MISLKEKPPDLIAMEIKMTIPQSEIFAFLQKRGYEIKAFALINPAVEEFLISEPQFIWHTFTATKQDQEQMADRHYLKVFESELKAFLNNI